MKRYFLLLMIQSIIITAAKAQRTYLETEISSEVFKHFELTFSPQIRFRDGFELKQYLFDAGVEYKINKHFSFGTSYRLGTNITTKGDKENFGRFAFDAKTKIKWKLFEPRFRLRYSNENDDFGDDDDSKYNYFRYKLELGYNFPESGFKPYISGEYFQNFTKSEQNKMRFEGGLNYKINSHNTVGAYYRLNSSGSNSFDVVGLSYKLKL